MDYNCKGGTDCCSQANCCEQASCKLIFDFNAKLICFATLNCESTSNFKVSFETIFFSFQQFLFLFELIIFVVSSWQFFFIIWESLSPCRCWLCLLRQGCPLLSSSLVVPLSVYSVNFTHTNGFLLSEWSCSFSNWGGNLSSTSWAACIFPLLSLPWYWPSYGYYFQICQQYIEKP